MLMKKRYPEYRKPDFAETGELVRAFWEKDNTFRNTLEMTAGRKPFIFYEGPPSANGIPGIHHVMARAIKDLVCRYKTMKGFHVERKGGWDTHGLPVEISVEKTLGITKEDIGTKIPVGEYNQACRREVMKYKEEWDELTRKMGYWVDLDNPYITFDNKYIESVWYLLKKLFDKDLLYKGYTIQPYSPAAGTGLSTHELNQPGCYRDVKDTTVVAQFKVLQNEASRWLYDLATGEPALLAWTTTPWTLPSNTALAVGRQIMYSVISTCNPYSATPITVVLASSLVAKYFQEEARELPLETFQPGEKKLPWRLLAEVPGSRLAGMKYAQLIPFVTPQGEAFRVIEGDFVTTEDGTGIVHIAPTFGADDDRVAKTNGIAPLLLKDRDGKNQPMVDRTGKFFRIEDLDPSFVSQQVNTDIYAPFAGWFTKNEFDPAKTEKDEPLDVALAVWLKKQDLAFRIEKYVHSYPHCWRTDKPILYYPLDSWFVRTTALKERMIELNKTINWKPAWTGEGRFGEWLKNLVDWNLSRSRFWGIPLPIWVSEDKSEIVCIGSAEELKTAIEKAVSAGVMKTNPMADFTPSDLSPENYLTFDFHRPYVDEIVLVSTSGKPMYREPDLIDVWFDSGAMPYAQHHYPFDNKETFENHFPADFIAEGVDQTRGWFFTLHAIATLVFDSVAFRNVLSNGLVLDRKGNKMSKRLGNAVDPFETINKYGPDATRWYLITNAQPWDNLKFDLEGVAEVQRKFFGTLYNTYTFFTMYANIDDFHYQEPEIPIEERPEIDRWILSELNTLVSLADEAYAQYEPTKAGRAIQLFTDEHLSNWYVRLSRRRFWKGEMGKDKLAAYQTLYHCLVTVAKLIAPIAPFYADQLFRDLNNGTSLEPHRSVHMTTFPIVNQYHINKELEERMQMAQSISSMVLSLRKRSNIRVRQPLQKIMIPVPDETTRIQLGKVADLISNEVNIKEIEYIPAQNDKLIKKAKPNFEELGPRYGKLMKQIAAAVNQFGKEEISNFEKTGAMTITVQGETVELQQGDVDVITEDIPGWAVTTEGSHTVALDVTITEELAKEGVARDFVNRIQNLRKELGFNVTDRIVIIVEKNDILAEAIASKNDYICSETLTDEISWATPENAEELNALFDLNDEVQVPLVIKRVT
jgi:isoleucyl-tRNA synthetase